MTMPLHALDGGSRATRSLAVCIPTCRRPRQLEHLLRALDACTVPDGVAVEVRVVDNDPAWSAEAVVASLAGLSGTVRHLRYAVEARPGFAHVRNCAIELDSCDLVAFIDDDEWPEPSWLERLVADLDRSGADAVIGPVLAALPDTAPAWLRRGRFRDALCGGPGEPAGWGMGRTGNALFLGVWFYEQGFRLDPAFSLTGGEDADLFSRLDEAGARFACSNAVVWEHVPDERLRLRWLMARSVRCGANFARISNGRAVAYHPLLRIGYRALRWMGLTAIGLSPLGWVRPERAVTALLDGAFLVGFVPAILRARRRPSTRSY